VLRGATAATLAFARDIASAAAVVVAAHAIAAV